MTDLLAHLLCTPAACAAEEWRRLRIMTGTGPGCEMRQKGEVRFLWLAKSSTLKCIFVWIRGNWKVDVTPITYEYRFLLVLSMISSIISLASCDRGLRALGAVRRSAWGAASTSCRPPQGLHIIKKNNEFTVLQNLLEGTASNFRVISDGWHCHNAMPGKLDVVSQVTQVC